MKNPKRLLTCEEGEVAWQPETWILSVRDKCVRAWRFTKLEFVHFRAWAKAPTSPLWQQGIRLAGLIRLRLGVKSSQISLFS